MCSCRASMLNLKKLQPEAKPLPDDHSLTLDDETKRAPAPVQKTRHFRNVSTPSMGSCAFSDYMKRHMSQGAPFQLNFYGNQCANVWFSSEKA